MKCGEENRRELFHAQDEAWKRPWRKAAQRPARDRRTEIIPG